MKFKEAVKILSESKVENAKFDAAEIFMRLGGYSRTDLLLDNPECSDESVLNAVKRRSEREPLQYILEEVYFYNECYRVTKDCLIPRSDTEILVDYAVKHIPAGECFIDLCTGSGCVGISTLKNTKDTSATLVDISMPALEIAKENAMKNGVEKRAKFELRDALLPYSDKEVFALLSNPPYVADSVYADLENEIFHEPKEAFVGGIDGGDFYRRLTPIYKEFIAENGFIAYEIGYDQADLLKNIAKDCSMTCEILKDLSGNDRVAVLRRMARE